MTKEEAVQKIIDELIDDGSCDDLMFYDIQDRIKPKLTAILTDFMKPIGEEEIQERSERFCPYTNDFNTIDTLKRSCFKLGARWAATRKLRIDLEKLEPYLMADMKSKTFKIAEFYPKSDIEKLLQNK